MKPGLDLEILLSSAKDKAKEAASVFLDGHTVDAKGYPSYWFPCGNAHLMVKGSTKLGRYLKQKALDNGKSYYGNSNGVFVDIRSHKHDQSYDLAMVEVRAAKQYLEEQGIVGLSIWSYVD